MAKFRLMLGGLLLLAGSAQAGQYDGWWSGVLTCAALPDSVPVTDPNARLAFTSPITAAVSQDHVWLQRNNEHIYELLQGSVEANGTILALGKGQNRPPVGDGWVSKFTGSFTPTTALLSGNVGSHGCRVDLTRMYESAPPTPPTPVATSEPEEPVAEPEPGKLWYESPAQQHPRPKPRVVGAPASRETPPVAPQPVLAPAPQPLPVPPAPVPVVSEPLVPPPPTPTQTPEGAAANPPAPKAEPNTSGEPPPNTTTYTSTGTPVVTVPIPPRQ